MEYSGVGTMCSTLTECLFFLNREDTSKLQSLSGLSFSALIPHLVKSMEYRHGHCEQQQAMVQHEWDEIGQKMV